MTASSSLRLALAVACIPALARAQAQAPPRPPTEAQVEAARAIYREARELHRQGRLKDAIDRAFDAYRTAATPVTALELGELLVEAARLVEARDLARGVAVLPVSPRESDKGRDARLRAASLAASLDARIPKLALEDRPAGTDVLVDDKLAPPSEGRAWIGLDPGPHAIAVRTAERVCATIRIVLAEGEERTVGLSGTDASCGPQPPSAPAARENPPVARKPPASPVREDPAPGPGAPAGPRWEGGVLAAAGTIAIAVGGGLAVGAKSDYDAVAAQCPPRGCTKEAYDVRQAARSRADVATVVMIGGAAAALGGAVWFFWPRRQDSPRVGVALSAGELRCVASW